MTPGEGVLPEDPSGNFYAEDYGEYDAGYAAIGGGR